MAQWLLNRLFDTKDAQKSRVAFRGTVNWMRGLSCLVENGSFENKGAFRQDLFFRINVFPINVPCLAERTEDIPALTRHFLSIYAKHTGAIVTDNNTCQWE